MKVRFCLTWRLTAVKTALGGMLNFFQFAAARPVIILCVLFIYAFGGEGQTIFQYDSNGNLTNVAATVAESPTINVSPVTQYVNAGADAALSVSTTGNGALSYQWFQNGVPVQGPTDSELFISSVTASNLGNYTVVVCDGSD